MTYIIKTDKETAQRMWQELGDIPIDEEECIEEEFYGFKPGTSRYEIWHWFESTFNLSVAEDLMFRGRYHGTDEVCYR